MNINQTDLRKIVGGLQDANLKILNHTLMEIESARQIKQKGSLRIPYSPTTETGLYFLIKNGFIGENKDDWLNEYYTDNYFEFDVADDKEEMLHELAEVVQSRIKSLGISPNLYLSSNRVELEGLLIDLSARKMRYMLGKEIRITPSSQEIRLLVYLIEKQNIIVPYRELAKQLGIEKEEEGYSDKNLARTIQLIKKNLVRLLRSVGMSNDDTGDLIQSVRGDGLILNSKL